VEFGLDQNYPNPFNPSTIIRFGLPEQSSVTLKIYDILGREIITLAERTQAAGRYVTEWNGRNSAGVTMSSGIYFYRLEARGNSGATFVSMKKMILMK
jgi:flagellar hook assembly protein FlgD